MLNQDQILDQCRAECRRKVSEVVEANVDNLGSKSGRISFEEQLYGVVLQMLSFIESENRKIRMEQQRKGIRAAKEAGKHFGREFKFDPLDYVGVCRDVEEGVISVKEAQKLIGASDTTIFRMRKKLRAEGLL